MLTESTWAPYSLPRAVAVAVADGIEVEARRRCFFDNFVAYSKEEWRW
jgi:hypothetical protein